MAKRLHHVEASELHARRERVFLVLAGLFIGSMAMLNILGIAKFIHIGPLELAVGVLPYPLTFLCTDFISELYGRARANFVVVVGLIVNLLVLGFVSAGDALPSIDFRTPEQRIVTLDYDDARDAEGNVVIDPDTGMPMLLPLVAGDDGALRPLESVALMAPPGAPPEARRLVDAGTGRPILREESTFGRLAVMTRQVMLASMVAYLFAQFVDVWLFHFWKRVTRGRMPWLRNNASTLVSQLVDTVCVVLVTFGAAFLAGELTIGRLLTLIASGYAFKFVVALLDTIPFILGVRWLGRWLEIDPMQEHRADDEESTLAA